MGCEMPPQTYQHSGRPARATRFLRGVFLCACILAVPARSQEARTPAEPGEIPILAFRAARVPGEDIVRLQGDVAAWLHVDGDRMRSANTQVINPFPKDGRHYAVIRDLEGTARVHVSMQPYPSEDYELRVSINGSTRTIPGGLSFNVVAAPIKKAPHHFNVVVITLDTLRADRLGCYGYERPVSRNLDAFAKQCVRFTNAFSTSSFTPPAHASLLTSQYVQAHRLLTWGVLANERLTLAESLQGYGYRSAASINLFMLTDQGLGQGFEWQQQGNQREARRIVEESLYCLRRWMDQPTFLWAHFYDIHRPYCRQGAWLNTFNENGDPEVGRVNEHYTLTPAELKETQLTPEDLQFIADRYDAGIAYTDSQLGPLLDELSTPMHRENTLVIITADHGEVLLERNQSFFDHDPYLYREVAHIPLLIRFPGCRGAGQTRDEIVSLIDVAPTVLSVLEIPPPDSYQGVSLLPLLDGKALPREQVFLECWGKAMLKAVRTREGMVLDDLVAGNRKFFDVVQDPAERTPLPVPNTESAQRLQAKLDAFLENEGARAEPEALPPGMLQELEALGYLE